MVNISNRLRAILPVALTPTVFVAALACLMISGRCQSSSHTEAVPPKTEGSAQIVVDVGQKKAMTMATAKAEVSLKLAGAGEAAIDWGDGTEEKVVLAEAADDLNDDKKVHKYADASYRTITITGENITKLWCHDNELTSLDVGKNTALAQLNCGDNKLVRLDVSKNDALTELSCWGNQLILLDVSNNTALTNLNCNNNQLIKLDLSKNVALARLWCNKNQLDGRALDALFGTLHSNPLDGEKTISMYDNPGLSACDQSIATGRGWEIALEFYD